MSLFDKKASALPEEGAEGEIVELKKFSRMSSNNPNMDGDKIANDRVDQKIPNDPDSLTPAGVGPESVHVQPPNKEESNLDTDKNDPGRNGVKRRLTGGRRRKSHGVKNENDGRNAGDEDEGISKS